MYARDHAFYNQQLLSQAYIDDLMVAGFHVGVASAVQQTLLDWRREYQDLDNPRALSNYVTQCLSTLGFSYSYDTSTSCFVLKAPGDPEQAQGLCFVTIDPNIGNTTKGLHHQERLVRALRKQCLRWGMVTNGID